MKPAQLTLFPTAYLEETARAELLRRFTVNGGWLAYEYRKKGNSYKHDLPQIKKLMNEGLVVLYEKTNTVAVFWVVEQVK